MDQIREAILKMRVFAFVLLCGIAVCGCTGNQDVNSIGSDVDTVQQESVLSEDEQLVQRYVELVNNGEGGSVFVLTDGSVTGQCLLHSTDGGNAIALQFVSDDRGESFIAQ